MAAQHRKTGLAVLGDLTWGAHACHFYETQEDLLDTALPYFKAGLEAQEFCLWIVDPPLGVAQAARAVRHRFPEGERHLAEGRMEIVASPTWYLRGGRFAVKRLLRVWDDKLQEVLARGFAGMRVAGGAGWLDRKDWKRFSEYERELNDSLAGKPMIVLCSYALHIGGAAEILNVARTHQYAIAKRGGAWEVVEWRSPPTPEDAYDTLTTREREVLLLAAEGMSNPRIAARLAIGVRTVESHRANLLRKLRLRNQTELVRYALARGLLPVEPAR